MTKKRNDDDGLTPEQIAMFKSVVRDPVLFASHVLGLDLVAPRSGDPPIDQESA